MSVDLHHGETERDFRFHFHRFFLFCFCYLPRYIARIAIFKRNSSPWLTRRNINITQYFGTDRPNFRDITHARFVININIIYPVLLYSSNDAWRRTDSEDKQVETI